MLTNFSRPQPDTTGPRNPIIRVWRSDMEPSAMPSDDYLTVFESAMTRAFVVAFRQADKRGQA